MLKRKRIPAVPGSTEPADRFPSLRKAGFIERIVSGGQTGVDRAALDFALKHGILHGGWCPCGRLAEDGPIARRYQLVETPDPDYAQRTIWNVRDSDGTLLLSVSPRLTGGSALTRDVAVAQAKPWLHLSRNHDGGSAAARLRVFIRRHHIKVLNIAGPRLSTEPAACPFARRVLEEWLRAELCVSA